MDDKSKNIMSNQFRHHCDAGIVGGHKNWQFGQRECVD